jgi:lysophospholipase
MDWRQPDGVAPRGSLLFAGGRGDFIEKYLEAHAWWHARGWNVTAFDWRGQGGSQGDLVGGHLDSLDPLVDDLAALIASWRAAQPGPHVAVAHSMGGHILLRVLAERRPELEAAVLVAPMVRVEARPLPPRLAGWIAAGLAGIGFGRRPAWKAPLQPAAAGSRRQGFLTRSAERYEDETWWWQREPSFNLGAPSWGWLRAAFRSSARLTPAALAGIRTPVLLLAAERDRLVSTPAIRAAAAAIPGAELMVLADSGHEILREADPVRRAALARIDAFLDAQAPA